jgi:hypothetical protein
MMTDEKEKFVNQLQTRRLDLFPPRGHAKFKERYGSYRYCIPAQDQIIAYIEGMKIKGTYERTQEDSQSDKAGIAPSKLINEDTSSVVWEQFAKHIREALKSEDSSYPEVFFDSVAALVSVEEHETDTAVDDVSQWSPDRLASTIMHPEAENDMTCLREMILVAEDTGFSVEQSEQLSEWLLSFAQRHCDSDDPKDEAPVWSAIRTGASMLRPDVAESLLPLLEPGHSIETSLVTVKMVGRIFEAQPPAQVDEHEDLANEVFQMASSLLNRYAIASSQNAAMAQLAIYALAAMASSKIDDVVKEVQELNALWFTQQTLHELRDLASIWANRTIPVAGPPQKLLDSVIQAIDG